jgi:hypothetical protein
LVPATSYPAFTYAEDALGWTVAFVVIDGLFVVVWGHFVVVWWLLWSLGGVWWSGQETRLASEPAKRSRRNAARKRAGQTGAADTCPQSRHAELVVARANASRRDRLGSYVLPPPLS